MMVDDAYAEALGRAVFLFAVLEWMQSSAVRKWDPGYGSRPGHTGKIRTSFEHADNLVRLVKGHANPKVPAYGLPPLSSSSSS